MVTKSLTGSFLNQRSWSSHVRLAQSGQWPRLPRGNPSPRIQQIQIAVGITLERACLELFDTALIISDHLLVSTFMVRSGCSSNSRGEYTGSKRGMARGLLVVHARGLSLPYSSCTMSHQTSCPPHLSIKSQTCAPAVLEDLNTQLQPLIPQLELQPNRESGTRRGRDRDSRLMTDAAILVVRLSSGP